MRLIDHLLELGLARADAKRALERGKVFVGGVPTALATREVDAGAVEFRPTAPRSRVGSDVTVVHRGRGYAVVHKPPGLLAVPAPGRRSDPTVLSQVASMFGSALAVHRLDEDTSGLMLVATDAATQIGLKQALAEGDIERAYLALVSPRVPDAWARSIRSTLVRDRGDGKRGSGTGTDAKPAVTHVRAVQRIASDISLVQARLETGRTHQIRIHLGEAGHAVLGDTLYAPPRTRRRGPRLALHSHRLALTDPAGERLTFEVPLPDDLEAFVRRGGVDAKPARVQQG